MISDSNQVVNRCSTPMSSHCQSVSESFIEDNLIENDGVDDVTSFCDGASQDDASEINVKQNDNLCNLDVERETGKCLWNQIACYGFGIY